MFGKAAESVGDSCCLCGLVYFIGPVNLYARTHIRGKIREKKGINVSGVDYGFGAVHNLQLTWALNLAFWVV